MRKVMIARIAAALMLDVPVLAVHEGEEIDLTPRKSKPREPEPIFLRPPRVEHKDKSPALARMLKSKGRK